MTTEIKHIFQVIMTNLKKYKVFIIVVLGYLLFFEMVLPHEPNCIVKHTIGLPCPGCGMTRALYYLLTLQFEKALFYHPLVVVMPLVAMILLLNGYSVFSTLYYSKVFWASIIISFIITYVIRMYLYFPTIEPMDFYFS